MANPVYVLPDPMLALAQYLRLRPELTALVPASNIITQSPATLVYPYVLITLAGGGSAAPWPAVDEASMQIDVITDNIFTVAGRSAGQSVSSLIARTVRAAVWAISNDVVPAGCLSAGFEELAPQWFPDVVTTPPLARFMARYRIILHP